MSNPEPIDITLTEPQPTDITSDLLVPVIAKVEDALVGERVDLAFFAILAIAIISQYPGMTDDQISKGLDRIAMNIVQMCQEYEFENKLKDQMSEKQSKIITN